MTTLEPTLGSRRVGVVVIGRNEGERLADCLASVFVGSREVVYVDSNSTDGSPERAAALGVDVVPLDLTKPFTAARARNEGSARLFVRWPGVELVQFVDGDCVVDRAWIAHATAFLDVRPDVVAVCGRRRERYPARSIYNRLCDLEWDTPIGETKAFGGDVLLRRAALVAAGGYRDDLIAGEEPELCVRLRARGGRIWRLDHEMTLHDAAMTRLSQWWKRSMRAGHAFMQGARLHGAPPERHWVRESRRALFWGLWLPAVLLAATAVVGPWALLGFSIYPLQVARLARRASGPASIRWARAGLMVLGKFAEAMGGLQFYLRSLLGGPGRLIEYK